MSETTFHPLIGATVSHVLPDDGEEEITLTCTDGAVLSLRIEEGSWTVLEPGAGRDLCPCYEDPIQPCPEHPDWQEATLKPSDCPVCGRRDRYVSEGGLEHCAGCDWPPPCPTTVENWRRHRSILHPRPHIVSISS